MKFICPDTPAGQWYSEVMYTAKTDAIIRGYPVQGVESSKWNCKPEQTVSKVEALKILLNIADVDLNSIDFLHYNQYADTDWEEWYAPYTAYARLTKLLEGDSGVRLHPGDPLSRRDMVKMTVEMKSRFDHNKLRDIPPSFQPEESVWEAAHPVKVKPAAPAVPAAPAGPSASAPAEYAGGGISDSSPALLAAATGSGSAAAADYAAPSEPEAALPEPEFPPIPSYLTPGKTVRVCTETQPYKCEVIKLPKYGVTVNEEPVYEQYADPWLWYVLTISGKNWYTPWDDLREGYVVK
jgi:hypothetical protein